MWPFWIHSRSDCYEAFLFAEHAEVAGARKGREMIRKKGTKAIAFCLVAIFLAIGCATTKKITQEITGKGRALKKKVALLPTVNKTGYGGEAFKKSARIHLNNVLNRLCDDLIIIDSKGAHNLLEQIPRLPSGQLDNLALAKLGRALGLNAVVEENFFQLECLADKRGIWGFRDPCKLVQLSVRVRVYDMESAAVLLDEIVRDEVVVSEQDWQDIKDRHEYHKEIADHLLAKITLETCERVCEWVCDNPWKGYFTSVSENHTFTLSAGADVGLAEGDVLEVFGTNEQIKCQGGQGYLVSGPKIGEVQIRKVFRTRAEAFGVLETALHEISHVALKQ